MLAPIAPAIREIREAEASRPFDADERVGSPRLDGEPRAGDFPRVDAGDAPAQALADAGSASSGPAPAPAGPASGSASVAADAGGPRQLPPGAPTVTVSFTFDDTHVEQLDGASLLEAHGLRGTFYVNSPRLHRASARPDTQDWLSVEDALDLQARGHDVGGHTQSHLSLTDVPEPERIRELFGDRAELVRLGIDARSFAYPYGHVEDDPDRTLGRPVLEIARESGYTSARDTNGVSLDGCDRAAESLPPADAFILRGVRSVNEPPEGEERREPADTADTLLGWVDHVAGCGGGWLPLVFHELRADCSAPDAPDAYCFDYAELDRLAEALASGTRCPAEEPGSCYRIAVSTVSEAIAAEPGPAPTVAGVRNPSLERTLASGETECLARVGEGDNVSFGRSSRAASGQASEYLEIAAPFSTPAELRIERDYGECSVFAHAGLTYDLSLAYRVAPETPEAVLRLVTYRLTADYAWEAWERSQVFSASQPGEWARTGFATEPVPEGTIALSFGLRLESEGAVDIDDLGVGVRD